MSIEGTGLLNRFVTQESRDIEIEIMSNEAQGNHMDMLECLSVLINEDDPSDSQREELTLNEESFTDDTMLTAVTLPNGAQAFVANNSNSDDVSPKRQTMIELESGDTILLRNIAEFTQDKQLHLELEAGMLVQSYDAAIENVESIYPRVEFFNGNAYMVASHLEVDEDSWRIDQSGKSKKKDSIVLLNKLSTSRIRHPCPREGCTKVYSTPHHLKVHERSHTGQRPYRCTHPKCKKSFSTGYSLKAHSRTHTGEKPYECPNETCNKSFKTSGDLLKHIRTHTGERPFLCPFEGCGRSFTTSNIRKVHVRTHTGERPYKCMQPKCGKAFASATNYKNHIRIHSGEKPYVCSLENCGRRFTEYSSLYKHHLVHTQQRPFECKICCRKYRQSSTLVMHKRTAHAIVDDDDDDEDDDDENNDNNDGADNVDVACQESNKDKQRADVTRDGTISSLKKIELNGGLKEPGVGTWFEELNVRTVGIELGWQ